jgi:hypothetical protein
MGCGAISATLFEQGKYRDAFALQVATVEAQTRVEGGDHPNTKRTATRLAITRARLDEEDAQSGGSAVPTLHAEETSATEGERGGATQVPP